MSTILRATENDLCIHQPDFNFEDMATQAGRYLDGVRAEATKIVAAAMKEAEGIKRQAEADGRAAGMKKVGEMVQQRLGQQLETLLPALQQTIRDIRHAKQAWLSHWEKATVRLATAIAGRVVRRQIERDPKIPLALVREALDLAAGSSHLRIHLNPLDLQTLGTQTETLVREMAPMATAELLPDPAVTRGGCRLETQLGIIDQRLESQLARIEEELTEE
jgi:flagellar assembly protein FliH